MVELLCCGENMSLRSLLVWSDSIVVDEDANSMDVAVNEENLAQAIGRGGQNVRLASELTGWKLNVMSEEQAVERQEAESEKLVNMFMVRLDADTELAQILVDEGFTSIDEVAYVPVEEMLSIDGFDEDLVETLRARARDVLLTAALTGDESREPTDDLLRMEGMTPGLAYQLADRGVCTMDDLAELAVDELTEIEGVDEAAAAASAVGLTSCCSNCCWLQQLLKQQTRLI